MPVRGADASLRFAGGLVGLPAVDALAELALPPALVVGRIPGLLNPAAEGARGNFFFGILLFAFPPPDATMGMAE